jgi:hypothetical protein
MGEEEKLLTKTKKMRTLISIDLIEDKVKNRLLFGLIGLFIYILTVFLLFDEDEPGILEPHSIVSSISPPSIYYIGNPFNSTRTPKATVFDSFQVNICWSYMF